MRIYLFRHAQAAAHGEAGYADDAQRPLTDEGVAQARCVARGLQRLNIPVDVILSSPYVRAVQTAEHIARVIKTADLPMMTTQELTPDADPRETSLALQRVSRHEHVVLVGHEPHMSAWLAELVAGPRGMQCIMKKAGVGCVEIERIPPPRGSGVLRWLMTPKQLTLIGTAP